MAGWSTMRRVITLMVLLMAATEIFACQLVSPDSCIFLSHGTPDSSDEGPGDECLCCCAHIVIAAPITPLASLGFIARAVAYYEIQRPEVRSVDIEHPPRF